MQRQRPSNSKIGSALELKDWFQNKPNGFCYVTGNVRQNWYIGHNNLVVRGSSAQLDFKDIGGGVWLVTVKEKKPDEQKKEDSQGN